MKKRSALLLVLFLGCLQLSFAQDEEEKTKAQVAAPSIKRMISTPLAPKAIGPFSQAVEVNGTLYVSGQLPIDPVTGKIVEGGIREQTEQVMKNIGAILKAAGYDFKDVVKSNCMLSDMEHFKAFNEVYGKYYPTDPPARATFGGAKLALGALVEVETVAVKSK